jgi:hypothetical protein
MVLGSRLTPIDRAERFRSRRCTSRSGNELLKSHQEFELCCQWIQDNPDLEGKRNAYHWKHSVENWLRPNNIKPDYISQGVFILAAIYMGYKIHRIKKSTGARIGERGVSGA